jgi:hypothetical protein
MQESTTTRQPAGSRTMPTRCALQAPSWALAVLLLPCALISAAPGAEEVLIDGVPHVRNEGPPPGGRDVVQLHELWRRGGEDDEVFFGSISQVLVDPKGNIYVLDQQQSHVEIFSPTGEHLRTLSREGEGPGEVRRPEDMLLLPDGTLGLVQYFNGRIVKIDLDGTPAGTILPPGSGAEGGGMPSIRRARYRGGNLVVNGARVVPQDAGMQRTQYVASWTPAGEEKVRYLEKTTTPQLFTTGWIEKDEYFPEAERWAVGPQGKVYTASSRDAYAISVYKPSGELDRVIERSLAPRRRTAQEKAEIGEGLVVIRNGERMEIKTDIEDFAPAVSEIWVQDDGSLWVLPSPGERDQPEGVMQTYDVFDASGAFTHQVSVACQGDPAEDRLLLVAPGRMALIRGARAARQSMFGHAGDQSDSEQPEHEVVLLGYE